MRTFTLFLLIIPALTLANCSSGSGPAAPIFDSLGGKSAKKAHDIRSAGITDDGHGDDIQSDDTINKPKKQPSTSTPSALKTFNGDTTGWAAALTNKMPDGTPFGVMICTRAPVALERTSFDDFSDLFKVMCDGEVPSAKFSEIINNAFNGSGTPQVATLSLKISDLYVTNFMYAFGVKAQIATPAKLTSLPIYEEIGKGLITSNSELQVKKLKEATFPGKGVVRTVVQSYNMPVAHGASIVDTRTAETNTYLIAEGTQDINISAEHLSDTNNEFYNASRQLVVGIKGGPGETYLIYFNQFIVTNRFDPERLTGAAIDLAALIPPAVLRVVEASKQNVK